MEEKGLRGGERGKGGEWVRRGGVDGEGVDIA